MNNIIINTVAVFIGGIIMSLSTLVNPDLEFGFNNPFFLLFGLFIIMFFAANIEARQDALSPDPIKHWTGVFRFILFIGVPALFVRDPKLILLLSFYSGCVFWLVFDMMYNTHKGLDLDYLGSTSFLDRLAKKLGNNAFIKYHVIKGILLVDSVYFILKYLA